MNDQELIDEVRRLEAGTGSNQGIPYDQLSQKSFLFNKGFEYLLESWSNSSYSKKETWKWRQFVTMALEDPGKRAYMYRRTVSLLSDFGDSHKKYFILITANNTFFIFHFSFFIFHFIFLFYAFTFFFTTFFLGAGVSSGSFTGSCFFTVFFFFTGSSSASE